ncbi:phage tail sheath subtilisin-like domain-containing protein [Roseomonas xinghualingensis]|uniref:phage tail sheath subtilisin-like domain-containing protein n=1 Tax=Roseomonas xinghualingensis TaxID=2986475 RepID=UPI0021F241F4|nr:phage tail sheath subtilisin-like domain-containing protein [Roseomonas sp. SXEYE001]MCV4209376.1 phage tail sheath subtilisin-like domain-containing protein [Roseomonas sp. SXEYE001]
MAVGFNTIPADLRIPLFWAEFDNSQAGYGSNAKRTLLVGQTITPLAATMAWPRLVTSYEEAAGLFGQGSMLANMMKAYRANDTFGEVWVYPFVDVTAGAAATGTITASGTATAAGTIALYVAGTLIPVGVTVGMTAAQAAAAMAAAINAKPTLPVTASANAAAVTVTARHKGTLGNAIDLRANYRGGAGGESLPAGLGLTFAAMSGGTTDPDLVPLGAALGDEEFDFVVSPYTGVGQLDTLRDIMGDTTGRWSWQRQAYGHVFSMKPGDAAALQSFGAARNDQHVTIMGVDGSPTPPYEWAAAYGGAAAVSLRADPARPLQTVPIRGVLAPSIDKRFPRTTQQTLLSSGIALADFARDGSAMILRAVTTYQRNRWGQADLSYLDTEVLFIAAEVVRRLRSVITQKFARSKLANDGTRFGAGQPIVTPKIIKAELVAQYAIMEEEGLVENAQAFAAATIVERSTSDVSRVNVLYAPDFINGLRVLAVLAQFRS